MFKGNARRRRATRVSGGARRARARRRSTRARRTLRAQHCSRVSTIARRTTAFGTALISTRPAWTRRRRFLIARRAPAPTSATDGMEEAATRAASSPVNEAGVASVVRRHLATAGRPSMRSAVLACLARAVPSDAACRRSWCFDGHRSVEDWFDAQGVRSNLLVLLHEKVAAHA